MRLYCLKCITEEILGKEYDSCTNSSESPTMSSNMPDGNTSSSGSVRHVAWHSHAYDNKPLAEPGEQAEIVPDDADGIPPATLEQRSNGGKPPVVSRVNMNI